MHFSFTICSYLLFARGYILPIVKHDSGYRQVFTNAMQNYSVTQMAFCIANIATHIFCLNSCLACIPANSSSLFIDEVCTTTNILYVTTLEFEMN